MLATVNVIANQVQKATKEMEDRGVNQERRGIKETTGPKEGKERKEIVDHSARRDRLVSKERKVNLVPRGIVDQQDLQGDRE